MRSSSGKIADAILVCYFEHFLASNVLTSSGETFALESGLPDASKTDYDLLSQWSLQEFLSGREEPSPPSRSSVGANSISRNSAMSRLLVGTSGQLAAKNNHVRIRRCGRRRNKAAKPEQRRRMLGVGFSQTQQTSQARSSR